MKNLDREENDKRGEDFREELADDLLDEIVKDAEEALASESEIKSLNFRS